MQLIELQSHGSCKPSLILFSAPLVNVWGYHPGALASSQNLKMFGLIVHYKLPLVCTGMLKFGLGCGGGGVDWIMDRIKQD